MKWTEEKTWKNYHHSESSFIYPKEEFINNPFRGLDYVYSEIVNFLECQEIVLNNEAIYDNCPLFKNIEGSSILLIGGGPSTNTNQWEPDEYDYIFSCNHFFLNDKVRSCNITGAFIGDEVNLNDKDFAKFLNECNATIFFENIGRNKTELKNFKDKNPKNTSWLHTRYHSKIGVLPRMTAFFSVLQPKSIDIIGMDGYVAYEDKDKYDHSFEKNKGNHGSIESINKNEKIIKEKYKEQYLCFWDYILHDVGKYIRFKNLGHGHPANVSTEILTSKLGEKYQQYLYEYETRL